jgi:hypothetical protein
MQRRYPQDTPLVHREILLEILAIRTWIFNLLQ